MKTPEFVHLHLHTDYSLLDGACDLEEVVEEASKRKMPAVAVTDHGNLFAAESFYRAAKKQGVKPIIGCEVYVAKGSRHDRGEASQRDAANGHSNGAASEPGQRGNNHLVLLCENAEGYRNLVKLVSAGFLEGFYYKPRIDYDLLATHSKGLIALSACLNGAVTQNLVEERPDEAREAAHRLRDIFGKENFFLEVQDQELEIEKRVNPQIVDLSRKSGIPLVATNDCHYLKHSDAHAQEVLLCIQTGKTMSDTHRMKFPTDQFFFKTAEEMAKVFAELPEALARTVAIAERCDVKIDAVTNSFPDFQVPEGHTVDTYFEAVSREGFAVRVPVLEARAKAGQLRKTLAEYEARLTNEIHMIQKMRYAGYFLIVWDFIRHARTQGIPVGPGRGSAAGSLVSYALQITDVDPLQYDLLFERFLNPERVSMPDIDIDFCMRRRGEVIEYVTGKYGRANVAQIITFGTMAAKAAIKDVGRAMDLPYGEVDRIAKLVPAQLNITLDEALKQAPQLKSLIEGDARYKDLMDVAKRLEGLARHASTHAAGVVISPEPLTNLVPLYKSNRDEITTQYDMKGLEHIGLLKMDFLGLTTLTVLDDTVRMIQQNRNERVDLSTLPLDDEATYKLFARGETTAIFQFESHGMRDILRRYQPTRMEDLTALNAVYRPGPIQGGMIDDFINRKHGKKKVAYDLPELKEILEETYGVILYQEQVMQIANRLPGFSLGEADILRRAMGKKNRDEMAAQKEKFLAGSVERKFAAKKAEKIFDLMAEFAGYGFNKSHSCAYALAGLSDRISEDALSRGVHGRAAHIGNWQHRKSGEVHQRIARHGHHRTSARRQFQRSGFHTGGRGHSIRAARHQKRGRKHGQGNSGRARRAWPLHFHLPVLRSHRYAPHQQARHGKPDQIGRHGFVGRAALANVCRDRQGDGSRAAPPTRKNEWPARPFRRRVCRSRTRRRTFARSRGMAGARNSGRRIRDRGLLHFRASTLEICIQAERIGRARPGRRRGTQKRRRGHRRRHRDRHALHAIAQGRPLGNSHLAGHDRSAGNSGLSGILRAPGNRVQEQRAADPEGPRERGRGRHAPGGDGWAQAGRHGPAPARRDARARESSVRRFQRARSAERIVREQARFLRGGFRSSFPPEGAVATLRADQRVRADQELVREVCRLCGDNAVQLETRT